MPEFVYLVRSGENTRYKIGLTNNVEQRLQQLNGKQAAYDVFLVFSIEVINAKPIEQTLHHKYKEYRRKGEWFELTEKQVENVIQDMKFLQFNEQIFYKTDYSDIPVKRVDIDIIKNQLETSLKEERYNKDQLSLDKGFKLVQLALVKGFIHTGHFLDLGINFFFEEDYELALMCFDVVMANGGKNVPVAYFWKAETLFHKLKIQSRKESNNQCNTNSEYQQDIKLIQDCYITALNIFEHIFFTMPSLKNGLNLARLYHAYALFLADYMDYTGTTGFPDAIYIYNKLDCINTRNIVVRDANTRTENAEYYATQIYYPVIED